MSEKEHYDFIKNEASRFINQIVRSDEQTKGIVNIEVKDDSYSVIIHKGTEAEATEINDLSKEKLMELIDENL